MNFKRSDLACLLAYDPETGKITWRVGRNNHVLAGDEAGHRRSDGYRAVEADGQAFRAHRVAWYLHYGSWPAGRLDHINRDPSDNRIANLRPVTHAQNIANTQSKMVGRAKGAYWHKQRQCWHSNITVDGKKRHLGVFETKAEAAAAFKQAAHEVYGEFARVEARP